MREQIWAYVVSLYRDGRKELIPENIMNVVVFIPIGILMGVMADVRGMMDERRWKKGWQGALIIGTGLGISISIETMQYFFHRGFAELDDVMHNTIGGMIGYGMYKMVTQISQSTQIKGLAEIAESAEILKSHR